AIPAPSFFWLPAGSTALKGDPLPLSVAAPVVPTPGPSGRPVPPGGPRAVEVSIPAPPSAGTDGAFPAALPLGAGGNPGGGPDDPTEAPGPRARLPLGVSYVSLR